MGATATQIRPGSTEWQARVSPSKIPAILGLSPWADPFTTWHQMRGNLPPQPQSAAARRGTFHEDAVLREFFFQHPELRKLRGGNNTVKVGDWLAATPDALAIPRHGGRRLIHIEAKTTDDWSQFGEEGTDEVPEHYYTQVITTAHLVQADLSYVFVCGPFWQYKEFIIQPDPELAEAVLAQCRPFWESVQSGEEPPLSRTAASYDTWTKVADPEVGEGAVDIDRDLAARYLNAIAAERTIKPTKAELVNILNAAGAREAVYDGKVVARKQRNSSGGISLYTGKKPPVITDTPTIDSWETT